MVYRCVFVFPVPCCSWSWLPGICLFGYPAMLVNVPSWLIYSGTWLRLLHTTLYAYNLPSMLITYPPCSQPTLYAYNLPSMLITYPLCLQPTPCLQTTHAYNLPPMSTPYPPCLQATLYSYKVPSIIYTLHSMFTCYTMLTTYPLVTTTLYAYTLSSTLTPSLYGHISQSQIADLCYYAYRTYTIPTTMKFGIQIALGK